MMRSDGRSAEEIRSVRITPHFTHSAEGSALIEMGATRVICTASVEETVPQFLRDSEQGWVTAEYGMLPGCSGQRIPRRASGRTQEIQRLIGRSLRSVVDMSRLGARTVWVDCDVIEADGGTRTASITGAYVALALAIRRLRERELLQEDPLRDSVAAISVGVVDRGVLVDLCYSEDSRAEVDMNLVMTGTGRYVEVQGTAESQPFSADELRGMTDAAARAIARLTEIQRAVLASA
jgi:ribonuclease PH